SQSVLYHEFETLFPFGDPPPWAKTKPSAPSTSVSHPEDYQRIYETPPIMVDTGADTELHMLICEHHAFRAMWSLKSFFHYAKLRPRLVIHDDGTLSESSRK